jgi:plastocyanin
MNMSGVIGLLVAVLLLGVGAWIYYTGAAPAPAAVNEGMPPATPNPATMQEEEPVADPEYHALVSYTGEGYQPASVTIAAGQTVRFVNNAQADTWPASAVHPTHSIYPGSSIQKCGTAEQAGIFDACRGLRPGEFWEFTFNETGEWRYHDHLRASHTGVIVVQ